MAAISGDQLVSAPDVRAWSLASGLSRLAIGLGLLAVPELSLRALGFTEVSPAMVVVSRIAGVRDLVLGVATLAAIDDHDRLRAATIANAVADTGDTFAFGAALGTEERTAGVRGIVAALPAAIAGAWTAWRLS
jgi:hypothetical protein